MANPAAGYHYGNAPPPQSYGGYQRPSAPYGAPPYGMLAPSTFAPGTDPTVIACFQVADQDGSGMIDDIELQRALSSYNQSFQLRTVHLLMYTFTGINTRKIGPKEFTGLFYCLQSWRGIFDRFDRDRSGKIDALELREALLSIGYAVSPMVLEILVTKYDKTGGSMRAIEYDNFIECCLTVKGLTERFKERDRALTGSATFSYEAFMLTVLPFLIA
ncbi:UNVERIFIED_CONTAM: Calcium-binding protein CBP [Sesamum calycinum]|uniref:Calcium-binding protein CBP n=3 Tax=Sesamum TaxID=4181 RepID=A0AAE2BP31_9LAMI|nr:Calcium-binding protein CBP [Sesamum angolense]